MANKNVTLKDNNSNNLYPITSTSNVFNSSNQSAEDLLNSLKSTVNIHGTFIDKKAETDLSNVTYPEIVYNSETEEFDGLTHTGAGDRVIEQWISSDGSTWYRKWKSGRKECGGQIYNVGKTNFTLPITFTKTTYNVLVTPIFDEGADSFWWAFVKPYNENTVTFWAGHKDIGSSGGGIDNNATINYYCYGY